MKAIKYKLARITVLFTLLLATSSCVEEYWPEIITNNIQTLIVDGRISNFPGPYTVIISATNSINDTTQIHISSAQVTIIDSNGDEELLRETSSGIYKSSPDGMQGIVGHAYKIKIILDSGKHYESEFEELLEPVEVDNVKVKESLQYATNSLEEDIEGYQFYVDTKKANSIKTYLFWEVEETYEYHSDYKIYFVYDGKEYPTSKMNVFGLAQTINRDTLFYCWKTQNINERFIYNTEYLSNPEIVNKPLHFVPFKDERLHYKYNILVKQFTISENAYTFLKKLEQQNNNEEPLFTSQPFQIRGNVSNIENISEPVLGYFMVASGNLSSRISAKAPSRIRYNTNKAFADTLMTKVQYTIDNAKPSELPIYFTYIYYDVETGPDSEVVSEIIAYVKQDCLDCQLKGGVAIKPEYWDW